MAHTHVRHPAGDLRSSKSAMLPICHRPSRRSGPSPKTEPHALPWGVRPELQASSVRRAKTQTRCGETRNTPRSHVLDAALAAGLCHRSERGPIETCPKCGGKLRVIACIEDPNVIATILEHIQRREATVPSQPRAPPRRSEHLDTPKPAQAVLERRLTLVCGLDVGDAPIRASFRAFPFPGTQSAAPPGDRLKPSLSGVLRRPHHSGGYSSYARACPSRPPSARQPGPLSRSARTGRSTSPTATSPRRTLLLSRTIIG